MEVDEGGDGCVFIYIWFVMCRWEYGVYLVYSYFGLCAVWYEFIFDFIGIYS